eukprot:COSAG06_NODE_21305_length_761_cov_4.281395_2_plen_28_part_01
MHCAAAGADGYDIRAVAAGVGEPTRALE